ncbi:unnamed protein product, partial [Ostreobium quekettii]
DGTKESRRSTDEEAHQKRQAPSDVESDDGDSVDNGRDPRVSAQRELALRRPEVDPKDCLEALKAGQVESSVAQVHGTRFHDELDDVPNAGVASQNHLFAANPSNLQANGGQDQLHTNSTTAHVTANGSVERGKKVHSQPASRIPEVKEQEQAVVKGKSRASAAGTGETEPKKSCSDSEEQEHMVPVDPADKSQQELIEMAFAGDDVELDFAVEKARDTEAELPNVKEPCMLPGWGRWASEQREPRWMVEAKKAAQREREAAAKKRKDAKLKHVIITEKVDKKAAKYTAAKAPFPFTSNQAYNRSLRHPIGQEYNSMKAFREFTSAPVVKKAGVIIDPIKYSSDLKDRMDEVHEAPAGDLKVATIVDGTVSRFQTLSRGLGGGKGGQEKRASSGRLQGAKQRSTERFASRKVHNMAVRR